MDLNVKTIQETFELVKPRAEEFASRFFATLFQDFPAIRPLFAASKPETQKRLLFASLVQVMHNLENPEFLGEYLGRLGERHAEYGMRDEHFACLGASLLKTLNGMFGAQWTPEYNRQWTLAFELVAALVRQGLERNRPAVVVPLRKESRPTNLKKVS